MTTCTCFSTDNGIVAKVFLELTEDDIEGPQLNITFGGKKILKKLLKQLKKVESDVPVIDS